MPRKRKPTPKKPSRGPVVETRAGRLLLTYDGPRKRIRRIPGVTIRVPYNLELNGRTFQRTLFTLSEITAN